MKAETLRRVLERQSRVKLFVATEAFCACCYVSGPQTETDGNLTLRTDSMLRVRFDTGSLEFDPFGGDDLELAASARFTRRIQTHRRHLHMHRIPEEYFVRAHEL